MLFEIFFSCFFFFFSPSSPFRNRKHLFPAHKKTKKTQTTQRGYVQEANPSTSSSKTMRWEKGRGGRRRSRKRLSLPPPSSLPSQQTEKEEKQFFLLQQVGAMCGEKG